MSEIFSKIWSIGYKPPSSAFTFYREFVGPLEECLLELETDVPSVKIVSVSFSGLEYQKELGNEQ